MSILPSAFFAVIFVYFISVFAAHTWSGIRTRKLSSLSPRDLLNKLHPVPLREIEALAHAHMPSSEHSTRDPITIWRMLGEARGVSNMIENTEIMIALASYAERWNPADMQFDAARMRRDGVLFRRAAAHLSNSVITANPLNISLYAHEVASTYYVMSQRLRTAMNIDPQFAEPR
ncbi:hypothetical protein HDF16_005940 [Granulicella aggregans]|uniref:Uncharacterized protein n=1 Tax=Granulicella aggregans TaxID=474949 RepID=A0A7W8E7A3_9BACT|nr:hypothetical protein [Granulicella aggregans]MBB5061204.1 hypothetical protein [Granulicella aggregans]